MLNLYRRHGRKCAAKHPEGSFTYEPDEKRRTAKKCSCPIHASGTLNGKFRRQNTRATEWNVAKQVLAPQQAVESWDTSEMTVAVAVSDPTHEAHSNEIRIGDAAARFLAEHQRYSRPRTQK